MSALEVARLFGFEETFSRAILTLLAMPDRERAYMNLRSCWPPFVREFMDAYASSEERERFRPLPRDVSIYLEVLSWGRGLDRKAWQILFYRAGGLSFRVIGEEYGVTREAVRQRYADAIDQVRLAAYAEATVAGASAA